MWRHEVSELRSANVSLTQQLEQAWADAGKPIKVADLAPGSYEQVEDYRGMALVQPDGNRPYAKGSVVAVYCDTGKVPRRFTTNEVNQVLNGFK
jgi:hypothetical protein